VRVIPVHPVSKADGLFGLSGGETKDTAFAFVDETVDAEFGHGVFRAQSQLLFDFDFHPESLAVEAVLVSLIATIHGEETLPGVLVGASPCMVNTHGVVRSDGTVKKAPAFPASVFLTEFAEGLLRFPEAKHLVFAGDEIAVGDGLEHIEARVRRRRLKQRGEP
jgi:hypothetical protein